MREIEFRCWYGNEFVYTSLVGKDDVGYFFLEAPECEKEYINNEPQQYTGLKDKNGIEIYEGDIVEMQKFSQKLVGCVCFDDGEFWIKDIHNSEYNEWYDEYGRLFKFEDVSVIGNMYENKKV